MEISYFVNRKGRIDRNQKKAKERRRAYLVGKRASAHNEGVLKVVARVKEAEVGIDRSIYLGFEPHVTDQATPFRCFPHLDAR